MAVITHEIRSAHEDPARVYLRHDRETPFLRQHKLPPITRTFSFDLAPKPTGYPKPQSSLSRILSVLYDGEGRKRTSVSYSTDAHFGVHILLGSPDFSYSVSTCFEHDEYSCVKTSCLRLPVLFLSALHLFQSYTDARLLIRKPGVHYLVYLVSS